MPNIKSSVKSVTQDIVRTERNRARRSKVRTFCKKVDLAIAESNKELAVVALRDAQSELHRAVTKGVIKLTTASRKISRLNARVKALVTQA